MGGSVLTVGVELLDAVVNFLVAAEHCADGALEGEPPLSVVESLRVLAEVEFAGLRVFAYNLEYGYAARCGEGSYKLAFLGHHHVGCQSGVGAAAEGYGGGVDAHTHCLGVVGHVVGFAFVVGHEFVGLLGVAGLGAELVNDSGAGPGHVVVVDVGNGESDDVALLVVLKHGRHLAFLGLKRPLHKAAAFGCIANACARSTDLVGEHRVTSSLGVCLEVGSRRVVAHISAEVARKLVESLLGGIDGIIDGCNFVIGNRSLAAVNLVDIGNSLSLHGVGRKRMLGQL